MEFSKDPLKKNSLLSKIYLNFYQKKYIKVIRQRNICLYKQLVELFKDIEGVKIIRPNLNAEEVPTAFSFLIDKNRDQILTLLVNQGYPVFAWPTLPIEILPKLNEFPEIEILARQLLQIKLYDYKPLNCEAIKESIYNSSVHNLK